jgi:hypothetical protein
MHNAIMQHEAAELRFMLAGMKYPGAHRKATSYERHYCESRGLDWLDYDRTYKRLLAAIMARNPKPTEPADLFHGDRGECHLIMIFHILKSPWTIRKSTLLD